MKKTALRLLAALAAFCLMITVFAACGKPKPIEPHLNKNLMENAEVDLSVPEVGKNGWYSVFTDTFDREKLNDGTAIGAYQNADGTKGEDITTDIWAYSPHYSHRWETQTEDPRHTSYWCPETVSLKDGKVEIKAYETDSHECDICPEVGRFSGGIETRLTKPDGSQEMLFEQAYGYFEATVKFPNANGLWSALWLQSQNQGKISHQGLDGTEIDVYESAFQQNPTWMGHALLWDGYGSFAKVDDAILDTGKNLYEGYHTFGLKWTPEYYVWYIDGVASWASNGGGVAKVEEFLRLTVEMDAGDGWGPHGQIIGEFDPATEPIFYIDEVKVYQNSNYQKLILPDEAFPYEAKEIKK